MKRPAQTGRFFYTPGGMFYPGGAVKRPGLFLCPAGNTGEEITTVAYNPRRANRALRVKYQARFRAMNAPCGICNGRLGEIHYDEPSDAKHPLSFVIDEIKPVSRWREFGYGSPREAAEDWGNLQAAHWCCNVAKSNKVLDGRTKVIVRHTPPPDGEW